MQRESLGPEAGLPGPQSSLLEASHWEAVAPRASLQPAFRRSEATLTVSGNGNPYEFGYWRITVPIVGGEIYTLSVTFDVENVDDLSLHVLNMVLWRLPGTEPRQCPHDYISHIWQDDQGLHAEETFQAPADATEAELQLGLRFAPNARVTWSAARIAPSSPAPSRMVKVTAVRWQGTAGTTVEANQGELARLVDQAAADGSDLVLLPEYSAHNNTGMGPDQAAEPVPDGPTCRLLATKARQHHLYVCAGLVEKAGDLAFNTTVLFDREGHCAGTYRKVHLYWPEEMWHGLSPGDELPVFPLEFGTVGVMTCYDSWFPETARLLGLKGAEIILFPSAGYHPPLLPARAVDNRVYVVASSLEGPGMVVDTLGNTVAETTSGLVTVPLDLSHRPTPHPNAGGSLNTSPGGRRETRNSLSGVVARQMVEELGSWDSPSRLESSRGPR